MVGCPISGVAGGFIHWASHWTGPWTGRRGCFGSVGSQEVIIGPRDLVGCPLRFMNWASYWTRLWTRCQAWIMFRVKIPKILNENSHKIKSNLEMG